MLDTWVCCRSPFRDDLLIYSDEPEEPEFNVSRLWRDTASNSVWEGTTNVLASETVRHLTRGQNLAVFSRWIETSISNVRDLNNQGALTRAWYLLKGKLNVQFGNLEDILADGRQIMFTLAWVISGILLALDSQRDDDHVAGEAARRWVLDGEGIPGEFTLSSVVHVGSTLGINRPAGRERSNWDCRIVWGVDLPSDAAAGYRKDSKL